jgi:hypothetical protein
LMITPFRRFFIKGSTLSIERIVSYQKNYHKSKYRSSIDFHSSPKIFVVLHEGWPRADDTSTINKNRYRPKLFFNLIDSNANSIFICRIEFPALRVYTLFLGQLNRVIDTSNVESSNCCSSLSKVKRDTLANTPRATCRQSGDVMKRLDR